MMIDRQIVLKYSSAAFSDYKADMNSLINLFKESGYTIKQTLETANKGIVCLFSLPDSTDDIVFYMEYYKVYTPNNTYYKPTITFDSEGIMSVGYEEYKSSSKTRYVYFGMRDNLVYRAIKNITDTTFWVRCFTHGIDIYNGTTKHLMFVSGLRMKDRALTVYAKDVYSYYYIDSAKEVGLRFNETHNDMIYTGRHAIRRLEIIEKDTELVIYNTRNCTNNIFFSLLMQTGFTNNDLLRIKDGYYYYRDNGKKLIRMGNVVTA